MRVIKFLLIASTLFALNDSNAQMFDIGLYAQHDINKNTPSINPKGVDLSIANYKYAAHLGVLFDKNTSFHKITTSGDYHFFNWHHAYLANRFTPFVGAQLELASQNESPKSPIQLLPKIGVKGSYDHFSFDLVYLNNGKKQFVQIGISYVLFIFQDCPMKRFKEINKKDWGAF